MRHPQAWRPGGGLLPSKSLGFYSFPAAIRKLSGLFALYSCPYSRLQTERPASKKAGLLTYEKHLSKLLIAQPAFV